MLNYDIYFRDIFTGHLFVSDDKKNITWTPNVTINPMFLPFHKKVLTIFDVYAFFKSRCYEDGRSDLDMILQQANMTSNDPYEWVKRTHGVTWEDYWWVKEPHENIEWKDVKVRD